MGLFFSKRIMKLPFGGRLTFGSGGFGLSFGKKGTRMHINSRGSYIATKVPGTNIYVGKKTFVPKRKEEEKKTDSPTNADKSGCGCGTAIGCFFLFLILGALMLIVKDIAVGIWNGNGIDGDLVGGLFVGVIIFLFILVKTAGDK